MSALSDRIAAEHGGWFNLDGVWRCNCGEPLPPSANADMWMRAHIAAVTEAAAAPHIAAQALKDFADGMTSGFNKETLNAERRAIKREARACADRIARGVTP